MRNVANGQRLERGRVCSSRRAVAAARCCGLRGLLLRLAPGVSRFVCIVTARAAFVLFLFFQQSGDLSGELVVI